MKCADCGAEKDVYLENSRTFYDDDAQNKPIPLCPNCADRHHEYWDEMWDDYNSGVL